jgi:hypothetical protein
VIGYSSYPGLVSTRRALQLSGWRLFLSPSVMRRNALRSVPLWPDGTRAPFALDNGAWSAYTQNRPFDEEAFCQALDQVGKFADFIVIPDIVAGGIESLARSRAWVPRLLDTGPLLLIPVQDGFTRALVAPFLSDRVGVFVGGTTEWKINTLREWGDLARDKGAYLHVGRVNSGRRIRLCRDAGANSFDGSGIACFPSKLVLMDNNLRQLPLWRYHGPKS